MGKKSNPNEWTYALHVRGFDDEFEVTGVYYEDEESANRCDLDLQKILYNNNDVTQFIIDSGCEIGLLTKNGVESFSVIDLIEEAWLLHHRAGERI